MVHRESAAIGRLALVAACIFAAIPVAGAQSTQDKPLLGTEWNLTVLGGKAVPSGAAQPHFMLQQMKEQADGSSGRLTNAFDGCNQLSGFYKRSGASLHIDVVTVTLLACKLPPVPTQEGSTPQRPVLSPKRSFMRALGDTSRFAIHGSTLDLLDERGTVVARFAAAPPE